jgi:hypothetical protein
MPVLIEIRLVSPACATAARGQALQPQPIHHPVEAGDIVTGILVILEVAALNAQDVADPL